MFTSISTVLTNLYTNFALHVDGVSILGQQKYGRKTALARPTANPNIQTNPLFKEGAAF
jgi:hypothetical protein